MIVSENAPLGAGDQNSEKKSEIIQKYAVYTMPFLISPPRSGCPEISEKILVRMPAMGHGKSEKHGIHSTFFFLVYMSPSRVQGLGGRGGRGDQNSEKNQKIIQKYAVYTMVFLIFQPLERGFGISEKSLIFFYRENISDFFPEMFLGSEFFQKSFQKFCKNQLFQVFFCKPADALP